MTNEKHEQGDHTINLTPEKKAIQTADAQDARNAAASDVKAVYALNQNAHSGSAGGDQLESIQIVALDGSGKQKVVAERPKEATQKPEITIDFLSERAKQPDRDQPDRDQTFKSQIDKAVKLQAPGEGTKLEKWDHGGVHEAIKPEQLVLQGYVAQQENPWQAFNRLNPNQQREIVRAIEKAGNVGQTAYEQKIEAVSESIPKGFYNVGKGLLDTGLAAAMFAVESVNEPEKVPETTKKLVGHLSEAISNGVRLSQFITEQAQEMGKTGDSSPAIRAIGFVIETANERWQAMPLEMRTEKGSELIAELGIGSMIGAGHKLAKSGKLVDGLETIAEHLKDHTGPGREKAKQVIGAFLEDVFRPRGLTANGASIPVPRDVVGSQKGRFSGLETPNKGDNFFAMSAEGEGSGSAFRGDHDLYSPINELTGRAKSFINAAGDLTPPDPVGLFKGKPVDVVHHLCGSFYKHHKQFSPFTSFSESGEIINKFGEKFKVTADLKGLEIAINAGEVIGVEIIPHKKLLQMIEESPCHEFSKKKARSYAVNDRELLIRGVIPKRFLTIEEMHK